MAAKQKRIKPETVFEADSKFRGDLIFEKPLLILGRFEGSIKGGSYLEIGPSAYVESHIEADYIVLEGQVVGNLIAREKVELKEGSKLTGNIRSPKVEMEEGVVFDGQCEMKQIAS